MRLIDAGNVLKAFALKYKETKELIDSGEAHLDNLAEGFTEAAHICDRLGMDCPDDSDFFCSYGKRKDSDNAT